MDDEELVQQLVKSLAFEVEAIATDNVVKFTSTNGTPLNVKVRVRNKDEPRLVQRGLVTVPRIANQITTPEKIRIIDSDQTILSFNVYMETEFEKETQTPKSRKHGFNFLKLGGCLGTSIGEDDAEDAYLQDASKKNQSGFIIDEVGSREKLKLNMENSKIVPRNQKGFFGKCKPGGCLDPPFSEDTIPYSMPKMEQQTKLKTLLNKVEESKENPSISNISMEPRKLSKLTNDLTEKEQQPSKREVESKPLVNIFARTSSSQNSLGSNHSNIITYPPRLSSTEMIRDNEDTKKRIKNKSFNESPRPSNENPVTYFVPPKDLEGRKRKKEEERRYSRELSNYQIRTNDESDKDESIRNNNNRKRSLINRSFDIPGKHSAKFAEIKPMAIGSSQNRETKNSKRVKQTSTDLTLNNKDNLRIPLQERKKSDILLITPHVEETVKQATRSFPIESISVNDDPNNLSNLDNKKKYLVETAEGNELLQTRSQLKYQGTAVYGSESSNEMSEILKEKKNNFVDAKGKTETQNKTMPFTKVIQLEEDQKLEQSEILTDPQYLNKEKKLALKTNAYINSSLQNMLDTSDMNIVISDGNSQDTQTKTKNVIDSYSGTSADKIQTFSQKSAAKKIQIQSTKYTDEKQNEILSPSRSDTEVSKFIIDPEQSSNKAQDRQYLNNFLNSEVDSSPLNMRTDVKRIEEPFENNIVIESTLTKTINKPNEHLDFRTNNKLMDDTKTTSQTENNNNMNPDHKGKINNLYTQEFENEVEGNPKDQHNESPVKMYGIGNYRESMDAMKTTSLTEKNKDTAPGQNSKLNTLYTREIENKTTESSPKDQQNESSVKIYGIRDECESMEAIKTTLLIEKNNDITPDQSSKLNNLYTRQFENKTTESTRKDQLNDDNLSNIDKCQDSIKSDAEVNEHKVMDRCKNIPINSTQTKDRHSDDNISKSHVIKPIVTGNGKQDINDHILQKDAIIDSSTGKRQMNIELQKLASHDSTVSKNQEYAKSSTHDDTKKLMNIQKSSISKMQPSNIDNVIIQNELFDRNEIPNTVPRDRLPSLPKIQSFSTIGLDLCNDDASKIMPSKPKPFPIGQSNISMEKQLADTSILLNSTRRDSKSNNDRSVPQDQGRNTVEVLDERNKHVGGSGSATNLSNFGKQYETHLQDSNEETPKITKMKNEKANHGDANSSYYKFDLSTSQTSSKILQNQITSSLHHDIAPLPNDNILPLDDINNMGFISHVPLNPEENLHYTKESVFNPRINMDRVVDLETTALGLSDHKQNPVSSTIDHGQGLRGILVDKNALLSTKIGDFYDMNVSQSNINQIPEQFGSLNLNAEINNAIQVDRNTMLNRTMKKTYSDAGIISPAIKYKETLDDSNIMANIATQYDPDPQAISKLDTEFNADHLSYTAAATETYDSITKITSAPLKSTTGDYFLQNTRPPFSKFTHDTINVNPSLDVIDDKNNKSINKMKKRSDFKKMSDWETTAGPNKSIDETHRLPQGVTKLSNKSTPFSKFLDSDTVNQIDPERFDISVKPTQENESELLLNMKFQTYVNENNEIVVQSLDPLTEGFKNDNVTVVNSYIRPGNEIRIQVDSEHNLTLSLYDKFHKERDEQKHEERKAYQNDGVGVTQNENVLHKNLTVLYESELVPLHDAIMDLTEEINALSANQELLKAKLQGAKRTRSMRLIPVSKNCGCNRS